MTTSRLVAMVALALGSASACHPDEEGPRSRPLRGSFPEQALEILGGAEPFAATAGGFAAARVREAPLRADAASPR